MNTELSRRLPILAAALCITLTLLCFGTAQAEQGPAVPTQSAAVCTPSDGAFTIEQKGHIGGKTLEAAVQGNYAYVAQGANLVVLDLSAATITQVAFLPLPDEVRAMAVSGNFAYILLMRDKGFLIANIANPLQPAVAGQIPLPVGAGVLGAVHMRGDYAYVPAVTHGLYVVDVRNAAAPALVRTIPSRAYDIATAGNYAYMIGAGELQVLSLADPANPQQVGAVAISGASQVRVAGQYAYVSQTYNTVPGLSVIDVSTPATPHSVASMPTTIDANKADVSALDVTGGRAYLGIERSGSYALVAADISNPLAPVEAARLTVDRRISSVQAGPTRVYLAVSTSSAGFREVDPNAAGGPTVVRDFRAPWDLTWLHSNGSTLYAAAADGLWVYNTSDPAHPSLIRYYPQWSRLYHVVVQGNLLFATVLGGGSGGWPLLILDAADPANLMQRSVYTPPGDTAQELFVRGSRAYLLTGLPARGFQVVNVSNPDAPALAGQVLLPGIGRVLHGAEDTFVYVGYTSSLSPTAPGGIAVVNVSNPASPQIAGTVALTGAPTALWAEGNRLAVGSNSASGWRVELFDLTNPAAPVPVAHNYRTGTGTLWSVELRDGMVFAGVQGQTLFALQPSLTGLDILASLATFSTVLFGTTYMDGTGTYGYGTGYSVEGFRGSEGEYNSLISGGGGANTYSVGSPPTCSVTGKVMPAQAAAAGCWIAPVSSPCKCGDPDSKVTFTAAQTCKGWGFRYFAGDNPMSCPESGSAQQIAWFGPSLMASGGGTTDLCLSATAAERKNLTALSFNLCASDAVDWQVTKLAFQASGSGNDQSEIEKVQLKHGGATLGGPQTYPSDNGKISFSFPAVTIPTAGCESFTLVYDLKDLGTCSASAKEFRVALATGDMSAEPKEVGLGVKGGAASGGVVAACVWNQSTHTGYDLIQPAVSAAADGHVIAVCPGDYSENVDVTKSLTVRSTKGRGETYVSAANAGDHVFQLQKSNIVLDGFTVAGATGAGKAGAYAGASGADASTMAGIDAVSGVQIVNSHFTGNRHGIYLNGTEKAVVSGNLAANNSEMGLLVQGATQSTITNNSFTGNTQDGARLLDCRDAAGQTKLTGNSARENHASGIHTLNSSGIRIETSVSIRDNHDAGILVENSDGVEVVGNPLVQNNGKWGISVVDSQIAVGRPAITIANNVVEGSLSASKQPVGIYLKNSRGVRVGAAAQRNTVRNHPQAGIMLENSTGGATEALKNVVDGNTIESNGKGIYLKSSCGNLIRGANAVGPGNETGIALENCQCPANLPDEIRGNEKISGNDGDGVALVGSFGNLVANNREIKQNKRNGVSLTESESPDGQPNKITGNHITRNEDNGIYLADATTHELTGNTIAGNALHGISMHRGSDITISQNTISGADGASKQQRTGIYLSYSESANTIDQNTIGGHADAGINVRLTEERTIITGNTLTGGSAGTPAEYGVLVENACRVQIGPALSTTAASSSATEANTISGQSKAGIRVRGSVCTTWSRSTILGNTLQDNAIGIEAAGVEQLIIGASGQGNTVKNSTTAGIRLSSAQLTTVEGNSVGPGNEDGIRLEQCTPPADAANRVSKNGVGQNTRYGIVLAGSYGNIIGGAAGSENTIVRNTENGLRLENCNAPEGRANTIGYNIVGPGNKDGVMLEGTTHHAVTKLTVQGNTGAGIRLVRSPYNKIHDNFTISGNTGDGISAEMSDEIQIYATEVRDNTGSGIALDRSLGVQVGLTGQSVKAIANKQNGLQLNHCSGAKIIGGVYDENTQKGIRINWGSGNKIQGAPLVRNNKGGGIALDATSGNELKADQPAFVQGRYRLKPVFGAQVLSNTGVGIHLSNGSNGNRIENFLVQRHTNGIFVDGSNNNTVQWNQIVTAAICVRERNSTGNSLTINTMLLCGLPISPSADAAAGTDAPSDVLGSLYLEHASPSLSGNVFEEDAADAIRCEAGAAPALHKNSFLEVAGFGLVNTTLTVTVDARENWWGDASGPGGSGPGVGAGISGTALFQPWRPVTVSVVVDAAPHLVAAPRGVPTTHNVAIFDWDWPADVLTVTVSDRTGWVSGSGTFTVSGAAIAGLGVPVSFTVPTTAALGATDTVTITAVSAYGARDTDTFQIAAAAGADVAIAASVLPAQPLEGTAIRYALVVTNHGPDSAPSVVVSDTLEAGLTFVSAQTSRGTCSANAQTVTCALGSLARGASANISITALADAGMALDRAAVASALPDPNPANNETALYTLVQPLVGRLYLPLIVQVR